MAGKVVKSNFELLSEFGANGQESASKTATSHIRKTLCVITTSTKMKWINTIFIILLLYSCNNENEKMSHSDLVDNDSISDTVHNDDI